MGSIDFSMSHGCQVLNISQDHKLFFTSGSVVFSVGDTIAGGTSGATAVIKSITLSSGSWATHTAAGYLMLYSVSGIFVTGESISSTHGAATASGTAIPQSNAAGTPTTTTVTLPSNSTYYDCLFSNISTSGNYILNNEVVGKVIESSLIVFLPSTATVQEGDQVTTTETNYTGTYEVQKVDCPEIPFSGIVDHKEAYLKKVVKRG